MITIVGTEYIIANYLILDKNHRITIENLNKVFRKLQQAANKENIEVLLLTSSEQVMQALYDFSDYFAYNKSTETISITNGKDVKDLEHRFIGYLPFKILCFIIENLNQQ